MNNHIEQLEQEDFNEMLVSILAHDLRQPLAAMTSATELIKHIGTDMNPREVFAMLQGLRETAERGLHLIDGLLCWIKLKKHGFAYQPLALVLRDLIDEANFFHIETERKKLIRLDNQVPAGQVITAQRQMLQFINRNLIGNAVRYSPEGGTVTISSTLEGNWLMVAVTDEGPGIPSWVLPQIFSGQLTGNDNSGWIGGAGVALSICHEMLQRMGGRIRAESASGKGTVITYSLPVAYLEK